MLSKTDKLLNELIKLHPKYIDLSLNRIKILLHKLGDPHLDLPKTIHIAGTNGKGSIKSYIKNILLFNGYSCDSYISPHLSKFNERIVLNNKDVSTKKLYETLNFVKKINDNNPITFFEITTAAAFFLFQRSKSDFLILETGLGGRLDATNIIQKKLCSIITPISFDHEEYLGNTLKKITKEKLGIVNKSEFILISKQKREVKEFIKNKLSKYKHVFYYGKDYKINELNNHKVEFQFNKEKEILDKPKLKGSHQIENAAVALAFAEIMKQKEIHLDFKKTKNAIRNTTWPGRLEILNYNNKKIILDGSHNIEGARKLSQFLKLQRLKPIVLFGMLNNKKIDQFLDLIKNQISSLLAIKIPEESNAFLANEISKKCDVLSINNKEVKNLNEALKRIREANEKVILVTGSLYLVGKIRNKFIN